MVCKMHFEPCAAVTAIMYLDRVVSLASLFEVRVGNGFHDNFSISPSAIIEHQYSTTLHSALTI